SANVLGDAGVKFADLVSGVTPISIEPLEGAQAVKSIRESSESCEPIRSLGLPTPPSPLSETGDLFVRVNRNKFAGLSHLDRSLICLSFDEPFMLVWHPSSRLPSVL